MNYFNPFTGSLILGTFLAVGLLTGCSKESSTQGPQTIMTPLPPVAPATNATTAGIIPYPLKTCVVSGEKLGGDMGEPVTFVYQNQEIKFCCAMCKPKFLKDPGTYMAKIHETEAGAKN